MKTVKNSLSSGYYDYYGHCTTIDIGNLIYIGGDKDCDWDYIENLKVHEGDPCNIGSMVGEDKIIVRNPNFSQ